jgi:PTH1 family peptidyl-tRNA hydrolase
MGLGNPGADYGNTRHNVGAWVVSLLARRYHAHLERQGRVDRAEVSIDGHRLAIARPRTYMNESGPAIAAEVKRLRIDPSQLLVIYDDLDLPVGKVRLRLQGGHGGNNGMRSIIGSLGTNDFPRVRIGIDRPYEGGQPVRDPDKVANWVLARPSAADRALLDAAVESVADAVVLAMNLGLEVAMNRLNADAAGAPSS